MTREEKRAREYREMRCDVVAMTADGMAPWRGVEALGALEFAFDHPEFHLKFDRMVKLAARM